jgi:hypothetical protein
MNALTRRLRRLEQRTFPPEDVEGLTMVAKIRERRRRYRQEQGLPFEADEEDLRGLSIPEIIWIRRRVRAMNRLRAEPCGSPAKLSTGVSERC